MKRREFLKQMSVWGAVAGVAPFALSCSGGKERRPNIVLIMADDVGYEILGCNGGESYRMPNIDKLAETGVRFTNCFSAPKCVPSRVEIMTGRYGFRTGQEWGYIPPEEITFGHVLKKAAYATALSGKWQLCMLKDYPHHIKKMGFDESCVFGWHEGPRYYEPYIYQNGKIRQDVKDRYGPDVFCEFLIDFIKRNRERNFLAYYPMALAHEISNDLKIPPPPAPDGHYQTYKELVEYMDKIVGRIVHALDELGLRENTLILFTGDNGSPRKFINRVENGEYHEEPVYSKFKGKIVTGDKGKLTDAGTHVPLIANWHGVTLAGAVCDDLIDFSDFMPTLAELAGAKLPSNVVIDGKSFASRIKGKQAKPREWVYNEWRGKVWVRTKRWKLYRSRELFDMKKDPREKTPILFKDDTDETRAMREKLQKILKELK